MTPEAIFHAVGEFYNNQPHPDVPSIKVRDYAVFRRVAGMLNDKADPAPQEIAHAHEQLQQVGLSPAEFERAWTRARPVANRLINRDPTMLDLRDLKDAAPHAVHDFYMRHPYPGYEEVTAGQMAQHWRAAEPIARRQGRVPNAEEVSRFASAGYDAEDIQRHYQEK